MFKLHVWCVRSLRARSRFWRRGNVSCAEKERSIAVISNAATGSEPNAPTVSQLKCAAGDAPPPEMCSPLEKDDITVILSQNISSSDKVEKLLNL